MTAMLPSNHAVDYAQESYGSLWEIPLQEAIDAAERASEVIAMSDAEANELAIDRKARDGLVVLNYRGHAPKTSPHVRYSRGTVIDAQTGRLVARAFPRFYNWGEMAHELDQFDFGRCWAEDKEDGSMILVFHHAGRWHAHTRGSHGHLPMGPSEESPTWRDAVAGIAGIPSLDDLPWDPGYTYVLELCSKWNRIVRCYSSERMYLLTCYRRFGDICVEAPLVERDRMAANMGLPRPARAEFRSIEQVMTDVDERSREDSTWEGYVISDGRQRWKVKSAAYLTMHRLRGNPAVGPRMEDLVRISLIGEVDEVAATMPQIADDLRDANERVHRLLASAWSTYQESAHLVEQKAFAIAVKRHPLASILFELRQRHGAEATMRNLLDAANASCDKLAGRLVKL